MAAKTEKGLKQEIVNLFPVRLRQILEALPLVQICSQSQIMFWIENM